MQPLADGVFSWPEAWMTCCALSCGLLLASERATWRPGIWLFKPLASTAFVATAVSLGALDTRYGALVLSGLALCWLGDLLLIPKGSQGAFLAGIASFLLGHVAYAAAFVGLGVDGLALALAAAVVVALGGWVLHWLRPHLEGVFVTAVPAYVLVIGTMVATSVAAVAAGASIWIAVGAWMFAVSDVSVARDRMVEPGFVNGLWGLPLYFGGQLALAASVAPGGFAGQLALAASSAAGGFAGPLALAASVVSPGG
jgi:uncharacterized membrane protein YhhN